VTEASSTALQTIIDEFKNISPELTSAFIFKKDGEILASTEAITEDQAKKLGAAYNDIADQAEVIGGVEALIIQGVDSQLSITSMDNYYLATVSSLAVDEKMVKALTCVIVPTVMKLLDQISPTLPNDQLFDIEKPEVEQFEETVQPPEETVQPPEEPAPMELVQEEPAVTSEPIFPKPPVNQFMVEKLGRLVVASDTVRVDKDVVAKWKDLYGDKNITQVNVETLEGKAVICKFKPMKKADGNAKGIIKIPEKILQVLQTGEGKLVIVKPIIFTAKEKKR
jgi:predicted regulator of Ras-like GTPase activity (Roadblock/LC7/MglB family)